MRFEETDFAQFIVTDAGRALRIGAGLALIGAGLSKGGSAGALVAVAGLVLLGAGVFDICVLGPLFGASHQGSDIRAASQASQLETGDAGSRTTGALAEA